MKLTKYEHACFTLEKDGQVLIVDPGNFTESLVIPGNVVGIVITHEHPDHFDPDMLAAVYDKNPESILLSVGSVVDKMPNHMSRAAKAGDKIRVGVFELEFFGEEHAEIHSSIPLVDNVGVMIDNQVYYPGDSFTEPHLPVDVLALPASGPWFKTSNAVDFLLATKPHRVFPTHNIHNSGPGQMLFDKITGGFAQQINTEYIPLDVQQAIEI